MRARIIFETTKECYVAISTLPYGMKNKLLNIFAERLKDVIVEHGVEGAGRIIDGKEVITIERRKEDESEGSAG